MSKTQEVELFDSVESVDETILKEIPSEYRKPVMGSEQWTDYVLSLLVKGEYIDFKGKKLPKADALRRVTTKLGYKVLRSESTLAGEAGETNGMTASVEHRLEVRDGDEDVITVVGLADANNNNLVGVFGKFLSANASTRAMGRAYRDLLQLQVCVAEELDNMSDVESYEDPEDLQTIKDSQKAAITTMCKKNGIDLDKFLQYGTFKYKLLENVPVGTAKRMMAMLNGYQSGTPVPEEIKK